MTDYLRLRNHHSAPTPPEIEAVQYEHEQSTENGNQRPAASDESQEKRQSCLAKRSRSARCYAVAAYRAYRKRILREDEKSPEKVEEKTCILPKGEYHITVAESSFCKTKASPAVVRHPRDMARTYKESQRVLSYRKYAHISIARLSPCKAAVLFLRVPFSWHHENGLAPTAAA